MKRRTKLGFALAATGIGVIALSSCTASFCSVIDLARMKFAFEPGISRLNEGTSVLEFEGEEYTYRIKNVSFEYAQWVAQGEDPHVGEFYYRYDNEKERKPLNFLNTILKYSRDSGFKTVDDRTVEYLHRFDYIAFNAIFSKAADETGSTSSYIVNENSKNFIELDYSDEAQKAIIDRDLSFYSYLRFSDGVFINNNWEKFDLLARKKVADVTELKGYVSTTAEVNELSPDRCPSSDYIKVYGNQLTSFISAYRTCLTTKSDKYGSYGYSTDGIYIGQKTWGDAWSKGFFEGLLVYPIGWLIDQITFGFRDAGASGGLAAFLGIVFVTFIIRTIMLLATWKQTTSNAKMTELQPEIQKIQGKYPNSNTNKSEKARMAQEMQALYKKHHVNPFITIIVMVIQFPVFICVWGALSGSAVLTDGTLLGLNLSKTIKDVLFDGAAWGAAGSYAAVTALILFLLMAGAQTISMLLPQWIQKKKAKEVAKLGKNPAQKQQSNRMKWFTYIMLALIIFMGFSLVSAMGIYWFIGAIFSIVQTLVIQFINDRKAKKR